MTGPTKPQGDFCLTPGFTARDKRAEWCGWRGAEGGPLLPLPLSLSPAILSLSLFNMHASNIPGSQLSHCAVLCGPAVDWAKIDCRGGPRAGCAPRALGLGPHRAPKALLLTPRGPKDRERRAHLSGSGRASAHRGCGPGHWPKCALHAHTWKPARIWSFLSASFLSGGLGGLL